MRTEIHPEKYTNKDLVPATLVFISAVALKFWYQTASITDLKWFIEPTVLLVKWMSGLQFYFSPEHGFYNMDSSILITKDCSGVNFLIIAVTLSVFTRLSSPSVISNIKRSYPFIIFASFVITITANTARIMGAICLLPCKDLISALNMGEFIHQTEGIFVYLFFLIIFYLWLKGEPHEQPK